MNPVTAATAAVPISTLLRKDSMPLRIYTRGLLAVTG